MAKLNAHNEIGRIEYGFAVKVYNNDGTILVNRGSGYRLHAKLNTDVDPVFAFNLSKEKVARSPMAAYYKKLLELGGSLIARSHLHTCITYLGADPDGVWSEMDSDYSTRGLYSVEEVADACRLFIEGGDRSLASRKEE